MNIENPKGSKSLISKNASQRRTFLKRTTAGAVIASIPGRSAWAGITSSIVASGHGSDWNDGNSVKLLSHGIWKQRLDPVATNGNKGTHKQDNVSFQSVFGLGSFPIGKTEDNTLFNVLCGLDPSGNNDNTWKGPSTVNCQIIAMFLNAKYNGTLGLDYPVVNPSTGRPFASLNEYADKLYELAAADPDTVGPELELLIDTNHA